jgi:hypothetical protein
MKQRGTQKIGFSSFLVHKFPPLKKNKNKEITPFLRIKGLGAMGVKGKKGSTI